MNRNQCEFCLYQAEDIETGEKYCSMNMDQDDMERLLYNQKQECTYFRMGDDYAIVKRQGIK